ncbi:cytochrome P450 [Kitasatospora sp. NPDC008050]|uniref:cytochrome P450 family protein n=1 Tax=Kitasatospora sp. NPDC008050 TaxID=3364021 RepID=UPI0036E7AE8E
MTRPEPSADTAEPELFGTALLHDPHGGYSRLREQGPALRTTTPDGAPVWLVTRYADVRAGLTDPRLSLNKATATSSGQHGASMPSELDAHLLNMDPPDHNRLRRLVAPAFTPRNIGRLRPAVQQRTDALLDRFQDGSADVMSDLAAPLALGVICDVLGVAEEDRRDFRTWTNTLRSPAPDAARASRQALKDMHGFLAGLITYKRSQLGEDLLSQMICARDHDDRLSEAELVAMSFLLLFAGYDNTANLIGNTVLALLTHPDQLNSLRSGTLDVSRVVDEVLRWNSPSMLASRRFAREAIQIGDVRIAAGERIWMSLVSANRDPQAFGDPGTFNVDRPESGHLGFGQGLHFCLGAALARLEVEIAVLTLVRRFPSLRLAATADRLGWCESFRNRGLLGLPVVW